MFTLVTDSSKYFRVKRGQTAGEIEAVLNIPVNGKAFAGAIIDAGDKDLTRYTADVGDTYKTLSLKFGVGEEELKKLNGFKPVYPTCKIFVPRVSGRGISGGRDI